MGHISKDCSNNSTRFNNNNRERGKQPGPNDTCFNCGGTGHWSKECPSGKGNDNSMRGMKCYSCGRFGHKANDCRNNGNGSNERRGYGGNREMKCYNCGQCGHKANECNN